MKQGIAALVLAVVTATCEASPISSCFLNDPNDQQQGITCNIYESLADGTPSEISNFIPLPIIVVAGFIGILENSSSSALNPSQWSDVLSFVNRGDGLATAIQLFSIGCNVAPGDTSCFPSPGQVAAFLIESSTDPTVFQAPAIVGTNTFNIYSNDTPEPASLVLVGAGFLCLWMVRRRAQRRAFR